MSFKLTVQLPLCIVTSVSTPTATVLVITCTAQSGKIDSMEKETVRQNSDQTDSALQT